MTCQHCQTWILDVEHRCSRCGQRVRSAPGRISPATYPIAATATAPAYDFEAKVETRSQAQPVLAARPGQQALFAPAGEPRVIPFDSLTSPAERDAIRLRAESARPEPLKSEKVEGKRARASRNASTQQRHLEFHGEHSVVSQPRMHAICDAPVAPAAIRVQAAGIDALLMMGGCAIAAGIFFSAGGAAPVTKSGMVFAAAALLTIPVFYKLLWAFAGQDSPGLRMSGLELVDFDGKRASRARRYSRAFGSLLSLLAAGSGMIWALVDEDKLTWHDHISASFPTFSASETH